MMGQGMTAGLTLAVAVVGHVSQRAGTAMVLPWAPAVLYALTVVLCGWAGRYAGGGRGQGLSRSDARERWFWWALALLLLALGISRLWDLQRWVAQWGRALAQQEGWYNHRLRYEGLFVAGVASCGVLGLILAAVISQPQRVAQWLALVAAAFLVTLVALHASSYHDVDHALALHIVGLSLNAILEMVGIVIIAAALWAQLRHAGRQQPLRR